MTPNYDQVQEALPAHPPSRSPASRKARSRKESPPETRKREDMRPGKDDRDRIEELQASIVDIKARMERERMLAQSPGVIQDHGTSIIALDRFIQATRDSGYKGTASAVSELVDNAIQASATVIEITVSRVSDLEEQDIEISVFDNGCGMDASTLRQALRFGGSTRFGGRGGLGRYGMGLPNASLSQARRVSVYSWQPTSTGKGRGGRSPGPVMLTYLDVDEITRREMVEVPKPVTPTTPPPQCVGVSGTLVVWSRCDRLENRRISTLCRKLDSELGRRFRYYIWSGLRISINGATVRGFDPLYLHPEATFTGARLFGEELRYEMRAEPNDDQRTGRITVRFSELPIVEWHTLPNEEKRSRGLSKGAGVSIIRAGREVDYGWFFMGAKHRENYDDWWRCEVHFDPVLDEAFGITHTKQQVRPRLDLIETLSADVEAIARTLNSRSRKAHLAVKASDRFSHAARVASERDHLLPALPKVAAPETAKLMKELEAARVIPRSTTDADHARYQIVERSLKEKNFYACAYDGQRLVLVLNPDHPFYRDVYGPLVNSEAPRDQQLRTQLELVLLCAARAETTMKGQRRTVAEFRSEWSDALAAVLNG